MRKLLVVDIETIPNMDAVGFLPEPKADGRLKDQEKIAGDIERKRQEAVDRMGLDPNLARICVVGYAEPVAGGPARSWDSFLKVMSDDSERELLREFWAQAKDCDKLGTFNGAEFDIPFILRRSWLLGVRPTRTFETTCWRCATGEANHIDARLVLSGGDTHAKGTLDLYGKLKLGVGKTDGMDGSQVWDYWQAGRIDEVRAYCRDDCVTALGLIESLYGYYLPVLE